MTSSQAKTRIGPRVLAAPDKFRGTASAPVVAEAIVAGVRAAGGHGAALPLADGGEGTLDAFGGPNRWTLVTGPLGDPVRAAWRMTDTGTAVIEMALASGLALAGGSDGNDPWAATSRGTGELILEATNLGASRVLVGLGGSATTDGGIGAFEALLADPRWHPRDPARHPELVVCCDVQTHFLDAAAVFAPQKGADRPLVEALQRRLVDTAGRYREQYGIDITETAGTGAAGGLAGGLAVLGGRLTPGFDVIAEAVGLDAALARCDLVVTGEGQLDEGSFKGKVVGGVVARARDRGIPVVAVVGTSTLAAPGQKGLLDVLSLAERFGVEEAMTRTVACVRLAVEEHLIDR